MNKEGQVRIPSGCAIAALISRTRRRMNGEDIIKAMIPMHERSNGLGGGFAGYGIYPACKDFYALHIFYDDHTSRAVCEQFLKDRFEVVCAENIPTRKTPAITDEPLIWRYFVAPLNSVLASTQLDDKEYLVRTVMQINTQITGAYVFSCGKNMGCFKAVGYPEDVGLFYRLDEYEGYCWTAHGRYPTNTPGWWGGAHPFGLLDYSIVHNGEISSYDANRRFIAARQMSSRLLHWALTHATLAALPCWRWAVICAALAKAVSAIGASPPSSQNWWPGWIQKWGPSGLSAL